MTATQTTKGQVYVFDWAVPELLKLIDAIGIDQKIIILESGSDGVLQLAKALEFASEIDAIHIFSHGSVGSMQLGSGTLNLETITNYSDALALIGKVLTSDGDILLYGCKFAAGVDGIPPIDSLSEYTDAAMSASTDATGADATGGDLKSNLQSGAMEIPVFVLPIGAESLIANKPPSCRAPGSAGKVTLDLNDGSDAGYCVTLQSHCKFLVAGTIHFGSIHDLTVVRHSADGRLGSSFDGDGVVTTDFGGDDHK